MTGHWRAGGWGGGEVGHGHDPENKSLSSSRHRDSNGFLPAWLSALEKTQKRAPKDQEAGQSNPRD